MKLQASSQPVGHIDMKMRSAKEALAAVLRHVCKSEGALPSPEHPASAKKESAMRRFLMRPIEKPAKAVARWLGKPSAPVHQVVPPQSVEGVHLVAHAAPPVHGSDAKAQEQLSAAGHGDPQRDKAATVLQAAWRGRKVRQKLAEIAQEETPYKTTLQYRLATHAYAPSVLAERPPGSPLRNAELCVYASALSIPNDQPALLHSFQREDDFKFACQRLNAPRDPFIGNVYNPNAFGDHDMRVNAAWMLGLAHAKKPALMTTRLDDETLVRRAALRWPASERTTEKNMSAYAREVIGMVQNGHFTPVTNHLGKQYLLPTAKAAQATLEGLQTPRGMPKSAIRALLEEKGVDVSGIGTSSTAVPVIDGIEERWNWRAVNTYGEI